jgi:ABC-2 type transport system ATP-binding protein
MISAQTDKVLSLEAVSKSYGPFKAVDDLNFTLPAGSICGFLGPNGAGKTTTIRMILDIIKPSSGSISILGENSALRVRHRIGYLPEEKGLYKKMKAWAVIAYFASLKGLTRKTARERAFELLERYGLKAFAEKPTEALSKGMSQKVQVLSAIAHDPEFVILDEPFSGLDPVNQEVMESIILDMARRRRTILFSTHVMQHAERLCDRIILLAKGKLIFDGAISEARRRVPRRVIIETDDDIAAVSSLGAVAATRRLENPTALASEVRSPRWELQLAEKSDSQIVLQTCFANHIRLKSFHDAEPSLHEVFMQLVGPEAREAGFR